MDMPSKWSTWRSVPRGSDHEPRKIGLDVHSAPQLPRHRPRQSSNYKPRSHASTSVSTRSAATAAGSSEYVRWMRKTAMGSSANTARADDSQISDVLMASDTSNQASQISRTPVAIAETARPLPPAEVSRGCHGRDQQDVESDPSRPPFVHVVVGRQGHGQQEGPGDKPDGADGEQFERVSSLLFGHVAQAHGVSIWRWGWENRMRLAFVCLNRHERSGHPLSGPPSDCCASSSCPRLFVPSQPMMQVTGGGALVRHRPDTGTPPPNYTSTSKQRTGSP